MVWAEVMLFSRVIQSLNDCGRQLSSRLSCCWKDRSGRHRCRCHCRCFSWSDCGGRVSGGCVSGNKSGGFGGGCNCGGRMSCRRDNGGNSGWF